MTEPLDLTDPLPEPSGPASVSPGHVTPSTPTLDVDPSKVRAVAISMGLALTATIAGATTLLSLARERNLAGIVSFVQSSEAVPFFAGVTTLAALGGIVWRTLRRKAREVYLAYHNRDRIAKLTTEIAPPPVPR